MKTFYVTQNGITISGMGRNRNTLDSGFNTRKTATKHAKMIKLKSPDSVISIETMVQGEKWLII